jgi:uncharacterized DUF497 family protein
MRVGDLVISDAVREKLTVKHALSFEEVEEVCLYAPAASHLWREGREGTALLYGRTFAGRYLVVVVLSPKGDGVWRVVTARDMTGHERRGYHAQKGR